MGIQRSERQPVAVPWINVRSKPRGRAHDMKTPHSWKLPRFLISQCDILLMEIKPLDSRLQSGEWGLYVGRATLCQCQMTSSRWELLDIKSTIIFVGMLNVTVASMATVTVPASTTFTAALKEFCAMNNIEFQKMVMCDAVHYHKHCTSILILQTCSIISDTKIQHF